MYSLITYPPKVIMLLIFEVSDVAHVIDILFYSSIFPAILVIYLIVGKGIKSGSMFNMTLIRKHINFSKHIAIGAPIGWGVAYMPIIILSSVSGPVMAGILGTLRGITGLANSFVEVIEVSLIAHISRLYKSNQRNEAHNLFKFIIILFLAMWLFCLILIINYYQFIVYLFDEAYLSYKYILVGLWIAYLFYFIRRMYTLYCRLNLITAVESFSAIVALLCSLVFLPAIYYYGIDGTLLIYIFTPLIAFILSYYKYSNYVKIKAIN